MTKKTTKPTNSLPVKVKASSIHPISIRASDDRMALLADAARIAEIPVTRHGAIPEIIDAALKFSKANHELFKQFVAKMEAEK